MTSAANPAITIDQTMDVDSKPRAASPPKMAVTRSDTPFHCSAAGNANFSLTIVSATLASGGGIEMAEPKQQEVQRRGRERARDDADHVANGLLARLRAEHVARLDVHEQVRGVAGHFRRHDRRHQVRRRRARVECTKRELRNLGEQ